MAQGFFYGPLGADDDFDAQQKELERRRKTASALDMQIGQAPPANASTKYKIGALIGNALSGGVAGMQEAELNKQSEDYSKRRQDFTRSWLDAMPRGTPEQPAIEPDPLGNEGLGTGRPMIPRAFPSRDEMTAWQGKGLPLGADADRLGTQAVSGMALDQQRDATNQARADSLAQTERLFKEAAVNREHEKEVQRIENARLYDNRVIDAQKTAEQRTADRVNENTQRALDRAMYGSGGGGSKLQLTSLVDSDGTQLGYDGRANALVRVGDGGAPKGRPEQQGAVTKGAQAIRDADAAIDRGRTAIDYLGKNPGAFGGAKAAGVKAASYLGDAAEGAVKSRVYTEPELEAQSFVGREGAQILKDLYGAALTKNEGSRATPFEYKSTDTPEMIAAKIAGIMKILSSKADAQSPAALAVARPGRAPSSLPPVNAKGWALKTDKNGNKAYVSPDGKQFDEVQ